MSRHYSNEREFTSLEEDTKDHVNIFEVNSLTCNVVKQLST